MHLIISLTMYRNSYTNHLNHARLSQHNTDRLSVWGEGGISEGKGYMCNIVTKLSVPRIGRNTTIIAKSYNKSE